MSPEEIRAEAIERLACADYTRWLERVRAKAAEWGETCEHLPWDEAPNEGEWGRDRWRRIHRPSVDALGDMLPTGVEWGIRYEAKSSPTMENASGIVTQTMKVRSDADARRCVENGAPINAMNRRVVSRYAFDWQEVTA